jgi:methyltransferase (TIGR00027 family)
MKPGRASQTAVLVCMGRAAAHGKSGFSDPTALALLPDDARARVERFRAGEVPRGIRARMMHGYLARQSLNMLARTVAIDEAIAQAAAPQLVILGAGLDGRAWRLGALAGASVFEVDHPDTQRDKRARVAGLAPVARDIRFVPVDFTVDDLDRALDGAGHDRARPTTWLWEGVVMYLERAAIEATLRVIARRSAAGSALVVLYHAPALMLHVVRPVVRRLGEPLRSTFEPPEMRALLSAHGFDVTSDRSNRTIGAAISPEVAQATRFASHLRLAVAYARGR